MKNYIKLESALFSCNYAYIDIPEYHADRIFIDKKIKVKFKTEMRHKDTNYVVIFCKFPRRQEKRFLEAMESLRRKMLLFGLIEYDNFCEEIIGHLNVIKQEQGE